MKQLILAYFTAMLCWSCENELGPLNLTEPPALIVNAILSGQRDDNAVYLYLTGAYETTCVSDGTVRLYINGELAETITACHDPFRDNKRRYCYPVKSHFRTGDTVKLEAETSDGSYKAWAETQVPVPPEATGADTLSVFLKEYIDSPNYIPYHRVKLHLKEQSTEKEQYFRLVAGVHCTKNYTLTLEEWQHGQNENGIFGQFVTIIRDTTIVDESYQLITRDDPALNDGKPQVSDDYIGLIPETENHFLLFNNQFFTDGQYTMTINIRKHDTRDIIPDYWGDEVYPTEVRFNNARMEIVYHLIAISKEEFNYLKGLSLRMDIDMDEPLFFEPNVISGNIHGGTGLFAIETWNTQKLLLDE